MRNIICYIIIITLSACNSVVENINTNKEFHETYKLTLIDSISFPLDAESQPLNECMQIYHKPHSDSILFTFYNEYNNSIYLYNYHKPENYQIIHLEKEGPNGVYPYASGYHIKTLDSIYFYSMYVDKIFLLNRDGNIKETYDLLANVPSDIYRPTMRLGTGRPLYLINDKLYISGYIHGEFIREDSIKLPLSIIYDMKTKSSNLKLGYPESYRRGNWGEVYYRELFWCYNDSIKRFILSFPNDHNIYLTDLNKTESKPGGSKYADVIKSIDHSSAFPMPKEKRILHYLESYFYSTIVYDKYRNVYYRFVKHPWINPQIKRKPWEKPLSIIIFDKNMNRIGETLVDFKYRLSSNAFLVTEEGLLLREHNDNEDEIKFGIFKLKKI